MARMGLRPHHTARLAGALYLAVVILSIFALTKTGGIVDPQDPTATSRNLLAGAVQYRVATVALLLATLCYIAVVGLLNELLRTVQPGTSRIAVLFGLAGCIIGALTATLQLTAVALSMQVAMPVMAPSIQALLLASARGNSVGLTLFGVYCLLLGWLVFRSGFIPKLFGVLLMVSGATWLVGNLLLLVEPRLAPQFLLIVGVAALGEILFALWLLLKGVDVSRWDSSEQAWAANAPPLEDRLAIGR